MKTTAQSSSTRTTPAAGSLHPAFRPPHSPFRIPHSAFRIPHSAFLLFCILHSSFFISAALQAQALTPVPVHFTEWTGAVDNDFFNPANWSTGIVPDGNDIAIRLAGDPSVPNKNIVANHTGTGDKTIQFFSIQSGANKVYTLEFFGNVVLADGTRVTGSAVNNVKADDLLEKNWLIINPVGRGFTFNGNIGSTDSSGLSADITYPLSNGGDTTRLQSYYILNSYTKLTMDGSTAGARVSENGLAQGIFTLNGNAQMDLSRTGNDPFIYTASGSTTIYSPSQNNAVQIGGLRYTAPETVTYVGARHVSINSKMSTGEISIMSGVFYSDNTGNWNCDVYGYITRMTGVVNFMGDGRSTFRIRSGAQYLVEGVHNGNIQVLGGATLGGSGVVNANTITIDRGGLLTPGWRGSTIGNSPDSALTINVLNNFYLNGSIGFDLVTRGDPSSVPANIREKPIHDTLIINLSGTMTLNTPSHPTSLTTPGVANIVVGMADSFHRIFPEPMTYELLTINSGAAATILGDFDDGITLPTSLSVSLQSSWKWDIQKIFDYALGDYVETKRTLLVTIEQMPFASPAGLKGKYLDTARIVDQVYATGEVSETLFESLNRQPAISLYEDLLDQLTPSTYQSYFPAAVVRTNTMLQAIDDRMHQDAACKRKKRSLQMFLDGYRQEASRAKNDYAAYSNYDTIATIVGADYAISEKFVAGAFLAYEYTQFDLDTDGGTSKARSYTAGLNARCTWNNLQLGLAASCGTDKYTSKRTVAMTGLANWADASTNGTRLAAAATMAYTIKTPLLELTPVLGLQYLDWSVDAFQERNANEASLCVHKQKAQSQLGTVGVRIARSFPIKHGALRPFFHYGWLHEFHTATRTLTADLFGRPLHIDAPAINPNGYRLDLGLDWNVARTTRINLRYHSEYKGAVNQNYGLRAGVTYTF